MELLRLAAPPITRSEWDALVVPEAYRAEIVQGEIVLSPGVSGAHARAQSALFRLMADAVPEGFEVVWGVEWSFEERGRVAMAPIPDLVVVPKGFSTPILSPPLLAVEVLSKSDLRLLTSQDFTRIEGKRRDYGAQGLADYLEVDLLGEAPIVRRYENVAGGLVTVDEVEGDATLHTERPFVYDVTPAALIL